MYEIFELFRVVGERVTEVWILIMMLIFVFYLRKKAVFLLY